jgi:acyl-CoA synthetase (AMP-forming)/AMP-acid ligase II
VVTSGLPPTEAQPAPLDPLTRWAREAGGKPAVILGDTTLRYDELEAAATRVARGLHALGARPGTRVLWCGTNAVELLQVVHACRLGGFVSVPVSFRATAHEMAHMIRVAEGVVLVADSDRVGTAVEACRQLPAPPRVVGYGAPAPGHREVTSWREMLDAGADSPVAVAGTGAASVIMFTSGTTGLPKGALRSSLDTRAATALTDELGLGGSDEVHLCAGPFYHAGPIRWTTLVQASGGTVVVMPRFDPDEWLRLLTRYRVTSSFVAPTMLKRILTAPGMADLDRSALALRCLIISGSPAPQSVKEATAQAFGDVLYECYGSTETGTNTLLRPEDQLRKPGSCGRPVATMRVRILDAHDQPVGPGVAGEVYIHSPMTIDRYVGTDEQLRSVDGYVSAGDLGYLDEDGYLFLVDRRNDTIVSGGVNVYPAEVEAALHAHPDVADVAVFGIPSQEWGESVHAVVEPGPGAELRGESLAAFARRTLASYKVPRSWEFRDQLPRNDSGKLLKQQLRAPFWKAGTVADVVQS